MQTPRRYSSLSRPSASAPTRRRSLGGDFGNGHSDLAVANGGSNTVSVLLGNGDGTFQPQHTYSVGSSPSSVSVADFNGDSRPHPAVANGGSNTVSVLLGNGDGTFQPQQTFSVGSSPSSVSVADISGDGSPDLGVSNGGSNTVSVLLTDKDLGLHNVQTDITTTATGPRGAIVNYSPPTASDEGSETPAMSCNPQPGSAFPVGSTTVTCTATDADDANSPQHASFTVTIIRPVTRPIAQTGDHQADRPPDRLPRGEALLNHHCRQPGSGHRHRCEGD